MTNHKAITEILGIKNDEKWSTHRLKLVTERVPFGSEMHDAIRVRAAVPLKKEPAKNSENPADDFASWAG
jgi:hypothetical protein